MKENKYNQDFIDTLNARIAYKQADVFTRTMIDPINYEYQSILLDSLEFYYREIDKVLYLSYNDKYSKKEETDFLSIILKEISKIQSEHIDTNIMKNCMYLDLLNSDKLNNFMTNDYNIYELENYILSDKLFFIDALLKIKGQGDFIVNNLKSKIILPKKTYRKGEIFEAEIYLSAVDTGWTYANIGDEKYPFENGKYVYSGKVGENGSNTFSGSVSIRNIDGYEIEFPFSKKLVIE